MPAKIRYPFWAGCVAVLVAGYFIIQAISEHAFNRALAAFSDTSGDIATLTEQRVGRMNDVNTIMTTAQKLVNKKQTRYAAYYYKRASDLDSNVRDAAYGWAYAVVVGNDGKLTPTLVEAVKEAIARVEKVDPMYIPMLELKLDVAKQTGDTASAEATQKRLDLLKK